MVAVAAAVSDAFQPSYERLVAMGFEQQTARQLAAAYNVERIERQCNWLPKRNPGRNTLGLLLRSNEEDWPEPQAELPDSPALRFAASFYAGWSGTQSPATARPSANDLSAAEAYVQRLQERGGEPEGWGREFGAYARRSEPRRDAPCSLVYALRVHGDAYDALLGERQHKAERLMLVAARRAHQEQHQAAYLTYLRGCEQRLQNEAPDAHARFAEHDAHQRRFLDRAKLSSAALTLFDQEAQRLTRLHLFFAKEPEQRVLDFWGWDEQFNPEPFRRAAVVQRRQVTG